MATYFMQLESAQWLGYGLRTEASAFDFSYEQEKYPGTELAVSTVGTRG